jgi:hypothetical protein
MDEVPRHLLRGLSLDDGEKVTVWWAGLPDTERLQVTSLCDPRQEKYFFGVVSDAKANVPIVIGGKFIPRDDVAGWAEWYAEVFDDLICRPDEVLIQTPFVRKFHIGCTRHEAARAALEAGRIPADFKCPLGSEHCPMRRLLNVAPNSSLQMVAPAVWCFVRKQQGDEITHADRVAKRSLPLLLLQP